MVCTIDSLGQITEPDDRYDRQERPEYIGSMDEPNIESIRSGGQTGVDRAALDAALDAGVRHGGWCPAGRRAEDGCIPERYRLQETASPNYAERTRLNVRDSDGTLILSASKMAGGTRLTFDTAVELRKPVFLATPERSCPDRLIRAWIRANDIRHLNVAGPRASASDAVYADARRFMDELFERSGPDSATAPVPASTGSHPSV